MGAITMAVTGKPTALTGAENTDGVSAEDQTMAPYVSAGGELDRVVSRRPEGRTRLPSDPNSLPVLRFVQAS